MTSLKEKRQALGKDLREIAEETKIRTSFLKAIEEHNFDSLPVEVYTRAYIKEYARYLDISPNDTLNSYERFLNEKNRIKNPTLSNIKPPDKELSIPPPSQSDIINEPQKTREKLSMSFMNTPILKLTIIVVIMLFSGYMFLSYQSSHNGVKEIVEYKPPPPKNKEVLNSKMDSNEPETKTEQTQSLAMKSDEKVGKEPSQSFKHSLNIIAIEKVWIQIVIDNKEKKDIILNAGQNLSYKANESFTLLIGNAGGVKIRFDDRLIENLGDSGKVIKITLPEFSSNI
ncbi:MAG: DUF4115 domain-containing protein [Thermodesulfovibrionales bacterium]|nr:DUF4115 domain-containing protein [Thermodesulfovibrionales bacterium]